MAGIDIKEEKKALGALLGKAKSKPINFAFLIGKDGPIFEADVTKSSKALWTAGKKKGGGKGACGSMHFANSCLTLTCEDDPAPVLDKSFKTYLKERGQQIKFNFLGPKDAAAPDDAAEAEVEAKAPPAPKPAPAPDPEPAPKKVAETRVEPPAKVKDAPVETQVEAPVVAEEDDEPVSGIDVKELVAKARKRPMNAAWLIGKEGLVLRAHPRMPVDVVRRKAKEAGGGTKGAVGVLTVQGKILLLTCEDKPPQTFAKLAQKDLMAQGVAMKVRIALPDGTTQDGDVEEVPPSRLNKAQLQGDLSEIKGSIEANAEALTPEQKAKLDQALGKIDTLVAQGKGDLAETYLARAAGAVEQRTGAPVVLAAQPAPVEGEGPSRFEKELAAARSAYRGIVDKLNDKQRAMFEQLFATIDGAIGTDDERAAKTLKLLQDRLVNVKIAKPRQVYKPVSLFDQGPTLVEKMADQVSSADKARIDAWAEKFGNAENGWQLWDDEGGEYLAEALNGKSDLGTLSEAQMVYLSDRVAQMWKRAGSEENVSEAVSGIEDNPQARKALAMAFANGEAGDARHFARGGTLLSDPDASRAEAGMLLQAIDLDPAAAVEAFQGVEGYLGRYAAGVDGDSLSRDRQKALLDVVGDGSVDPVAADKMVGALYMATTPDDLDNDAYRASMAKALAQVNGGDDPEATAKRLEAIMDSDAVQEMMCGEKVRPDLKMWILAQAAADPNFTVEALADGWESEIVSQLAAGPIMAQYEGRGTEPKELPTGPGQDAALRNTIGQALGLSPDNLPGENETEAEREARREAGLNHDYYGANPALDAIAGMVKTQGGDPAKMSVIPVVVTNKEIGVINTKVFRLERDGGPCFVDTSGKKYDGVDKWLSLNELPPGKMTYPDGLVLGAKMVTVNTPCVKDTIWEWIAWVGDGVALGVGITVGVVAIATTGGLATPLVVAGGGAALWQVGRAGERLYDDHQRGTDITDLSNPNVRGNWLEAGAGALSIGAMGAAVRSARLVSSGAKVSSTAAKGTAALQLSADAMDATAMGDQALQLYTHWDNMSGGDRATQLLSMAFWGGMAAVSTRASGAQMKDATSFNKMANMAETGSPYPVNTLPDMAPGEIRVAYDMDGGKLGNVRIETGAGPVNKDMLDLHTGVGRQIEASGALTARLKDLLGDTPAPKRGTAGWEAKLEIDKIASESQMLAKRLETEGATLTPDEIGQIKLRQQELAAATQQQALRLQDAKGAGFIASPTTGDDQRIKLGWPEPPKGNVWVASADGKPYVRRTKGSDSGRMFFDERNKTFIAYADRPDVGMTVVGHGDNEMTILTRDGGETAEAHAVLRKYHKNAKRSAEETSAQTKVGKSGEDGDEGGHVIGHRFGLDQGMENMFPQDANFNKGAYKTMENEMANWIDLGQDVHVSIKTSKYDGDRPSKVEVSYVVKDPKTGKVVYSRQKRFSNDDKQVYKRLSRDDMETRVEMANETGE
ncbi:DUF4781 domain-containing protein [uncultured Tateyamaria sp.]|uniref:DUF4781 domain-containing protein n=1 Tax=uncultured Tateyamaria sp. TaxID=455651 RepID=UPI002611C8FF|nr:DUF4781 domain-containing protein [uncultured Tateyamaria sp.]